MTPADMTPAEIRELFLYLRPGESSATAAELSQRRDAMEQHNPERVAEYRSASLSTGRWKREFRSASSKVPMTLAELDARLEALEETLGVQIR